MHSAELSGLDAMYISLNLRWPFLLGQQGSNPPSSTSAPSGGSSLPDSAFKTVTSSQPPHHTTALPPISTLKSGPGHLPALPPPPAQAPSLPPPPPPPSQPLPPTPVTHPSHHHHHGHHGPHQAPPSLLGSPASAPPTSLTSLHPSPPGVPAHMRDPRLNLGGLGNVGFPNLPSHPSSHTHPAFPVGVPPWLPNPQAINYAHLQHLFGNDKALAMQYLNDPLARAALMDLSRMGQYPLGKKLFGCPQCRYITDRKNNLKRHIATMHQECDKMLECCGIMFKNKASLRDHVLIFHSNGYMCRYCGRNFCRKALLKRHLTVHSGQKDFLCEHCDYATSHKSNLERHKKVHERPEGEEYDENQDDAERQDRNEVNLHQPKQSPTCHTVTSTSILPDPVQSVSSSTSTSSPAKDSLNTILDNTVVDTPTSLKHTHGLLSDSDISDSHITGSGLSFTDMEDVHIDVEDQTSSLIDVVDVGLGN